MDYASKASDSTTEILLLYLSFPPPSFPFWTLIGCSHTYSVYYIETLMQTLRNWGKVNQLLKAQEKRPHTEIHPDGVTRPQFSMPVYQLIQVIDPATHSLLIFSSGVAQGLSYATGSSQPRTDLEMVLVLITCNIWSAEDDVQGEVNFLQKNAEVPEECLKSEVCSVIICQGWFYCTDL